MCCGLNKEGKGKIIISRSITKVGLIRKTKTMLIRASRCNSFFPFEQCLLPFLQCRMAGFQNLFGEKLSWLFTVLE
jgi:hypothetical protein